MLLVGLVPVAVLLRFQLGTELLENGLEQLLLASLIVGVAGPDSDLNSVPTNGIGNTADIIVESYLYVS